jgi:hypothetical protein
VGRSRRKISCTKSDGTALSYVVHLEIQLAALAMVHREKIVEGVAYRRDESLDRQRSWK